MRVLVTGGTGFLGSHIARQLLEQGHAVTVVGRDFAPVAGLLAQGAAPLRADLRDHAAVMAACAGQDAVIHAGAFSAAWGPKAEFHAVNVGGTQAVVAGCRRHGVARLVYISSPSVIFDGHDHVNADETWPYPQRFTSAYALTKKLGEDAVNAATDVPSVILRPKAIFGPGDRALLPRLIAAAHGGKLRRFGDGTNRVDLTYVENAAHAACRALTAPHAVAHTYFITNAEHVLLWPTLERILRELRLPHQLKPLPVRAALAAAAVLEAQAAVTGHEPLLTRYTVGVLARTQTYNIAAAQRDLDYAPPVNIEQGIQRTLAALL